MLAENTNQQKRDLTDNYFRLYYKLNLEEGNLSPSKAELSLLLM